MDKLFLHDERLGIRIPSLTQDWEEYSPEIQESILFHWETIRGRIPDRIAELEEIINLKQAQLEDENDFEVSCRLNEEIAELASVINDLWLWYRIDEEVSNKMYH